MYTTLAEVPIEDLPRFLSVFATRGAEMRRKHGSRGAQVFCASDGPLRAFLLIEWESKETFERFRADPEVPPTMKSGGIKAPPKFTALDRLASLPY